MDLTDYENERSFAPLNREAVMSKLVFVIASVSAFAVSVASASVFPPVARGHLSTVCAFYPNGDAIACVGHTAPVAPGAQIDILALHASAGRELPTLTADAH